MYAVRPCIIKHTLSTAGTEWQQIRRIPEAVKCKLQFKERMSVFLDAEVNRLKNRQERILSIFIITYNVE